MSDVTQYNEQVETAFLDTSRRLRQALTALQACVNRLNETCSPNEEWWQDVDALFEDGSVHDPRSKTHILIVRQNAERGIKVTVPHALNISNNLNWDMVQTAVQEYCKRFQIGQYPPIPATCLTVAGHVISVEPTELDDTQLSPALYVVNGDSPW